MPAFQPRLTISSRSFQRALTRRRMALEQVPETVRDIGFSTVEMDDHALQGSRLFQWAGALMMRRYFGKGVFFREYTSSRLFRLHTALEQVGTRLVAWSAHTDFTLTDRVAQWQLGYLEGAIATADDFGARLVCIQAGGSEQPSGEEVARCIEGLKQAAELARRFHTRLALENGEGLTRSIERTIQIVRDVNSPHLGVCFRFGDADSAELARYAIHVHAQASRFDAQGNEPGIDFAACLAGLGEAQYKGWLAIDYTGDDDPALGVLQTAELIGALT